MARSQRTHGSVPVHHPGVGDRWGMYIWTDWVVNSTFGETAVLPTQPRWMLAAPLCIDCKPSRTETQPKAEKDKKKKIY